MHLSLVQHFDPDSSWGRYQADSQYPETHWKRGFFHHRLEAVIGRWVGGALLLFVESLRDDGRPISHWLFWDSVARPICPWLKA
jgi:hypothetical protein